MRQWGTVLTVALFLGLFTTVGDDSATGGRATVGDGSHCRKMIGHFSLFPLVSLKSVAALCKLPEPAPVTLKCLEAARPAGGAADAVLCQELLAP